MISRSCYTADEVAVILGVTGNTIRRMLRNGTLPGARMGDGESPKAPWRIQHEDLDRFMRERGMTGIGASPDRPTPQNGEAILND